MYTLKFDGLYRGISNGAGILSSAGLLCYGWLITRKGIEIARGHGACVRIRDASSSVAEYLALIEGLDALADMGLQGERITIVGDARTVIDQMRGVCAVHSHTVLALYRRANRLALRFDCLMWSWTPRRNNKAADLLTRKAMRQLRLTLHKDLDLVSGFGLKKAEYERSPYKFHNLLDLRVFLPMPVTLSQPIYPALRSHGSNRTHPGTAG
jgi:ribonuclease HI